MTRRTGTGNAIAAVPPPGIDPQRTSEALTAPRLLACARGDVLLSARVGVGLRGPYDAGGLPVWLNDRAWATFGLEMSAQREAEIVSAVTRGASDRAGGFLVGGEHVWLRIARVGVAYAFHASLDGHYWRLIRHFTLYGSDEPSYGFFAQSPGGPGARRRSTASPSRRNGWIGSATAREVA